MRRVLATIAATFVLAAGLSVTSTAAADVKDDCYQITFRAATVCSKIPGGLPIVSDGS